MPPGSRSHRGRRNGWGKPTDRRAPSDATAITNEAVDRLYERFATSIRGFSSIDDLLAALPEEDWEFTEPEFQTTLRALRRQETVDLPGPPESEPPNIFPWRTYILKGSVWERVSIPRRPLTITAWAPEATADLWNGTLGPEADQRLESAQIVYHVLPGSIHPPRAGAVVDSQTKQAAAQTPGRPTRSELSGSTPQQNDQPEFPSQLGNPALSRFSPAGQPHVPSAKPTAERAFNQGPKENSAARQASPQPACIGFEFLHRQCRRARDVVFTAGS